MPSSLEGEVLRATGKPWDRARFPHVAQSLLLWESMKLILRGLLVVAMFILAGWALHVYAFDYTHGYPLLPLLALAVCFWACLRLRPAHARAVTFHQAQSVDSVLFLILALLGSTFILKMRGETSFQPQWFLRLATLTLFMLLVPYMAAFVFTRRHITVSAVVTLILLGLLWKGTELKETIDRHHLIPQVHLLEPVQLAGQPTRR